MERSIVKEINLIEKKYQQTKNENCLIHLELLYKRHDEIVVKPLNARGGRGVYIVSQSIQGITRFPDRREIHCDLDSFLNELVNSVQLDLPVMVMERLREPVYDPPEVDAADVKSKAEQVERDIDRLEREITGASDMDIESLQTATTKIRKKISRMRKDSLEKDGEFGVGNLAFKSLRNTGHIGKIIDLDSKLYDMKFTSE